MSKNKTNRQSLIDRVIRVKNWQEFKRLAINLKPDSVVYSIEQNGLSPERELTCLRLIMPTQEVYYVFLDSQERINCGKQAFRYERIEKGTDV
jgi:hypothetical protein